MRFRLHDPDPVFVAEFIPKVVDDLFLIHDGRNKYQVYTHEVRIEGRSHQDMASGGIFVPFDRIRINDEQNIGRFNIAHR